MVELFILVNGLAGDVHAELFEYMIVGTAYEDSRFLYSEVADEVEIVF